MFTPVDPAAGKPAAGVGVFTRRPRPLASVRAASSEWAELQSVGRVAHYVISGARRHAVHVITFYAWTGAYREGDARVLTDRLFRAVRVQLASVHAQSAIVIGDLNALPEHIAPYRTCWTTACWWTLVP